ncbi:MULTISPECIES: hypothetical protein [Corallococcus]|nr:MULTISPECIES: hypothetical protein [Corallococcus]
MTEDSPCQEITLTYSADNAWSSEHYSTPSDVSMYTFSQTP